MKKIIVILAFVGVCHCQDADKDLSRGEIAYKIHNLDDDYNLFQVTDGNYYMKALTSESQDEMTDCRMYKSKVKAKNLIQSSEAMKKVIGSDKIDQMLSKCGDVRNMKLVKSRRNNAFVDPISDTFNYNLVKGKPFKGDFHTGAPSGAGSHFAIYPGTKWCGYENVAENMDDLGVHNLTDSCCRTHDHCPYYIDRFETKFHYYNFHPWTVSHCSCDKHLFECLKKVNTATSDAVGKLFFGMLDVKCFTFEQGSYCSNESSLLSKLWCKKTSGQLAVMQQFPLKWGDDTTADGGSAAGSGNSDLVG